ncbi:MAG: fimbrillin family protein [Bacteroidaceae bacterium]|nr:fimbrillin family protein [Bacteroidaceae bacterium]
MRYITKTLILLFSLTLACCTEHGPIEFEPYPWVPPTDAPGTKFAIEGTQFVKDQTLGLYICKHEDQANNPGSLQFEEHNKGYNNVKVTYTGTTWTFYNSVLKEQLSSLYISTNDEDVNADVYAYAPYVEEAVSPREIPFDIRDNRDLMYVTQNASPTVNKDMPPSSVESDLTMSFRHVMAKLEFRCRIMNTGPNSAHAVDSIVIRKAGSKTTELYRTGVFNAMTGEITHDSTADSIGFRNLFFSPTPNNGLIDATTPKSYTVMLYPVEYAADGDFEAILVIDGFRKTINITRDNLKHTDDSYGLRAGYEYVFNIRIDNYIHLDGVTIKDDWETGSYEDEI